MTITFDRSICCDLNETISREWLVTNGLGGYAAGTIAGVLTRKQHGLLVVTPSGAIVPHLLLAKIDEEVAFDQRIYYLGTNEYRDGVLNPAGFVHLETFRLEEGIPIFTYRLGGLSGITLEKRIWMPYEQNTTCIQYRITRSAVNEGAFRRTGAASKPASGPFGRLLADAGRPEDELTLTLLPLAAYRPYNEPQDGHNDRHFHISVQHVDDIIEQRKYSRLSLLSESIIGCTIRADTQAVPYHVLAVGEHCNSMTFIPTGVWYWNFLHRHDAAAGLAATDDLYLPGVIRATFRLPPSGSASLTLIASAEELSSLAIHLEQPDHSYKQHSERQRRLFDNALRPKRFFGETGETVQAHPLQILPSPTSPDPQQGGEDFLRLLLNAADAFTVRRKASDCRSGGGHQLFFDQVKSFPALLSAFYNMEFSSRDTLIALPGLLLIPGRYDEARGLLQRVARAFRGGLLPDRLPAGGESLSDSDYGNVDSALWFFYALDQYLQVTRDLTLLEEIYYRLAECIDRYIYGTLNNIQVDSSDGLLRANQPGKALTWMNAMVDGQPITPRSGKAVEVNALWYNALSLMHSWSQYMRRRRRVSANLPYYEELLARCKRCFHERFWYAGGGYLYDVVDGIDGDDASLRPNQLLAFSLHYPVLDEPYRRSVFDVVTDHLLTPYGLRTLAPHDGAYRGCLGSSQEEQQRALHQGSVWTWLFGPYIETMFALNRPSSVPPESEMLSLEYLWRKGFQLLETVKERLYVGLLGMNEEVLAGDALYSSHPNAASAISTGELLRSYAFLARIRIAHREYAFSYDVRGTGHRVCGL